MIAIAAVGIGIILLNKMGLYGETNFFEKDVKNEEKKNNADDAENKKK